MLELRGELEVAGFRVIPARLKVLGGLRRGLELLGFMVIPAGLEEIGRSSVLQFVKVGAICSITAIEAAGQGVHSPDRME